MYERFILTLWIVLCGFVTIAIVRAHISRLLRLGIWLALFSARMFHRGFCNPVYLQDYTGSTSIKLDTLFYRLTMNENNGKIHIDFVNLSSIFRYSNVPVYFAIRFYFHKSRFLHLEVIWRSAHIVRVFFGTGSKRRPLYKILENCQCNTWCNVNLLLYTYVTIAIKQTGGNRHSSRVFHSRFVTEEWREWDRKLILREEFIFS